MLILASALFVLLDPWNHRDFPEHNKWLMTLDPTMFRNRAYERGLITTSEKEELSSNSASGKHVHNEQLLSYARTGGEKTFKMLLDTLKEMGGERYAEKCQQLSKLLPSTVYGMHHYITILKCSLYLWQCKDFSQYFIS